MSHASFLLCLFSSLEINYVLPPIASLITPVNYVVLHHSVVRHWILTASQSPIACPPRKLTKHLQSHRLPPLGSRQLLLHCTSSMCARWPLMISSTHPFYCETGQKKATKNSEENTFCTNRTTCSGLIKCRDGVLRGISPPDRTSALLPRSSDVACINSSQAMRSRECNRWHSTLYLVDRHFQLIITHNGRR